MRAGRSEVTGTGFQEARIHVNTGFLHWILDGMSCQEGLVAAYYVNRFKASASKHLSICYLIVSDHFYFQNFRYPTAISV